MNLRDFSSVGERRAALERQLGISLPVTGSHGIDEERASTRNCENMIGAVQVPVGVAGPLTVVRSGQQEDVYLPLATTEGALVASVNRGCKAISESGGAVVFSEYVGATRGPVFATASLAQSVRLDRWIKSHMRELDAAAKTTSSHISLIGLKTHIAGRNVYVRFFFDTGEAMGMNMVTIATTAMAELVEHETGARLAAVAGNYDTDKKPAWINAIEGRGRKVWAEVQLSAGVLEKTLKTTAQAVFDVWLSKTMTGSAVAGSMGFNAHAANIVAALFLATGQDLAHTVEGSLAVVTTHLITPENGGGLAVSVALPDVIVGSLGGGTALSTQKEALSILGITGKTGDAQRLAEIVGAAVLAGELSLMASLAQGTLARAHGRLARGTK